MGLDPLTMAIGGNIVGGLLGSDAASDAADTQAQAARDATAAQERMFNRQVDLQEPWRQAGIGGLNALSYMMGTGGQARFTDPRAEAEVQRIAMRFAQERADAERAAAAQPAQQQQAQLVWDGPSQSYVPAPSGVNALMPQPQQAPQSFEPKVTDADLARARGDVTKGWGGPALDPGFGSLTREFGMSDFEREPGYLFRQTEGEKALQRARAASGSLGSGKFLKDAMTFNQGLATDEYGRAFDRYNVNKTNTFNRLAALSGIGQTAANQTGAAASNFGSQIGANIIGAGNAAAAGRVGSANAWNNAIGQSTSMYQNNELMNKIFQRPMPGWGSGGGWMGGGRTVPDYPGAEY